MKLPLLTKTGESNSNLLYPAIMVKFHVYEKLNFGLIVFVVKNTAHGVHDPQEVVDII